jgi:TetR/AcrR family transcriptional regulator, regulator of mycofactocin system
VDDPGELTNATPEPVPQLPGPGRPPSTTRRQIQEIAVEMFSAHGYDQVTIEALAAAAGISRRTFFRYFPTKADTLMADFDQDVERLRLALRRSDPRLPIMAAIRRAVLGVNSYHADDLVHLRQRLQLQSDHPALLANAIVHYERWQRVVAEFAANRLRQPAEALVPQVIARAAFGAAYAGFMSWLCEDAGDLGPSLDAALGALADGLGGQPGHAAT